MSILALQKGPLAKQPFSGGEDRLHNCSKSGAPNVVLKIFRTIPKAGDRMGIINAAKAGEMPEGLRLQVSKVAAAADLGARFPTATSVDHLLSLIVKQTLDVMGVEICIIWLADKTGSLIPRISFGLTTTGIQKLPRIPPAKIMKRLMPLIEKERIRSLLISPLTVEEEKLGYLMVCTRSTRTFTDVDKRVFDALARQSALAIADIGLYDTMDRKMKEKTQEVSALFTLSRSLSSSISMPILLDTMLEKTRLLMKAQWCIVKLFGATRKRLTLTAHAGVDKSQIKNFTAFDTAIGKKAMVTRAPFVINNIASYMQRQMPQFLKASGINSLVVIPLMSHKRKIGVLSIYLPGSRIVRHEDIETLEMVATLCSMAVENATMLERVRKDYLNTIKTLAKIIDANDPYTCGHCEKVMKYSLLICRKLHLPERQVHAIKTASLLHDIGKIGIDLSIIRKPGKLNKEDWEKIRMHPEIGARIVSQVGFLSDVAPIIKHHHARYSGGGYPDANRQGEEIPIGARIIAVADAFDAMTSDRPYRKALPKKVAIRELKKCAGKQFDPQVVKAFLASRNLE